MSNPVQVNMYGIRYFIDGDLSDPHVKKLMVQARNDLQQMKDRNINNIPHIWLNKPNSYKIVSQFGIDSAYINVPVLVEEKKRMFELTEKKEDKKINVQYIIAHEVWYMDPPDAIGGAVSGAYANATQIGYLLCMGGGWNPPYKFIEPKAGIVNNEQVRNVIRPNATKAQAQTAWNTGVTVYPFFWTAWKAFSNLDDDFPLPPWGEGEMPEVELYKEDDATYTDIPCNLQEHVFYPYEDADEFHEHNEESPVLNTCEYTEPPDFCFVEYSIWVQFTGKCGYRVEDGQARYLQLTLPEGKMFDADMSIPVPGTVHAGYIDVKESIGDWAARYLITFEGTGGACTEEWYAARIAEAEAAFAAFSDPVPEAYYHGFVGYHSFYSAGLDYDDYAWENFNTWSCAESLDKYAVYFEWQDYCSMSIHNNVPNTGIDSIKGCKTYLGSINDELTSEEKYSWEQGLIVNGHRFILKSDNDSAYENYIRINPDHTEELAEAVCIKYFPNNWVVLTIQRDKNSWSLSDALDIEPSENGYPGPEMWCVWINMTSDIPELHWDQTFPPPIYDYGVIPAEDDEWWGGIFGNSTTCHFKKIPDAPLYKDENGVEWPMLTAGQFRLIRIDTEEELKIETKKHEYEIL